MCVHIASTQVVRWAPEIVQMYRHMYNTRAAFHISFYCPGSKIQVAKLGNICHTCLDYNQTGVLKQADFVVTCAWVQLDLNEGLPG